MKEIKNDKKMQDFIGRLFNEQYDSQGKGFKELADDIYCCSNGVFGKDDRTARRWINGDVELSLDKLKVLAEVFGVDVAELIEGRYLDSVTLKRENIEYKKQKEYSDLAQSLFRLSDSELTQYICIFALACILFYNQSTLKNEFITLFAFGIFVLIYAVDFKNFANEVAETKEVIPEFSLRSLPNKVKLISEESSIFSSSIKGYIFCVLIISAMPIVEMIFYKGTFFISGTICLIFSLVLICIKMKKD